MKLSYCIPSERLAITSDTCEQQGEFCFQLKKKRINQLSFEWINHPFDTEFISFLSDLQTCNHDRPKDTPTRLLALQKIDFFFDMQFHPRTNASQTNQLRRRFLLFYDY